MIDNVNNFEDFFSNKIAVLRNELTGKTAHDNQLGSVPVESPTQCVEFREFQMVTEQEVGNIVDTSGKKSCELVPLKSCKETLLPTFTDVINKSLETGCVPVHRGYVKT